MSGLPLDQPSSSQETNTNNNIMTNSVDTTTSEEHKKQPLVQESCWSAFETEITAPYTYIIQLQGKQIRSKFIEAFALWFPSIPSQHIDIIKEIAESLHSASLMIDDIEDSTPTRRGEKAAHIAYGVPLTINSANYVYMIALQRCLELKCPQAVQCFTDEMINLHKGQGLDIYWRDSYHCPTLEQYKYMVSSKTGGLFRLIVGLMQAVVQDSNQKVVKLVDLLGMYYQIRDDYVNLTSEEYMKTRNSFADDITEGKFSFPLIHAILFGKYGDRIKEILRMRTQDQSLKEEVISLVKQSGSFEFTVSELNCIAQEIHSLIKEFGGNKILEAIMHQLSKF